MFVPIRIKGYRLPEGDERSFPVLVSNDFHSLGNDIVVYTTVQTNTHQLTIKHHYLRFLNTLRLQDTCSQIPLLCVRTPGHK